MNKNSERNLRIYTGILAIAVILLSIAVIWNSLSQRSLVKRVSSIKDVSIYDDLSKNNLTLICDKYSQKEVFKYNNTCITPSHYNVFLEEVKESEYNVIADDNCCDKLIMYYSSEDEETICGNYAINYTATIVKENDKCLEYKIGVK